MSGSAFEDRIGFSRAVRHGNRIVISGTAPIADDGSVASPGDAYGQTKRCLEIIEAAIVEAGGSLSDVIRTRVYLRDPESWGAAGKAHGEVFSQIRPACTFVAVTGFIDPDWLVEIEAECRLDP